MPNMTVFLIILLMLGNMAIQAQAMPIAAAIKAAQSGETIIIDGGHHMGNLVIDKPLHLMGKNQPVIDGQNKGTVVKITVPGVVLEGFVIRNSGDSLDEENSGIAVEAANAVIQNNTLENTLFGIYLKKASHGIIRNNQIFGKELTLPRRGDPIRVWYSNDVTVESNQIQKGRDVVLWYSENLNVYHNTVQDSRYGLHFMYCDDAHIKDNLLVNNSVGAFLMYSRRLRLIHNTIISNRGPSGYGVGLKDMDDALIQDNLFLDNRIGAFVDNSPRELDSQARYIGNIFAYNDMGIRMMPSVRRNQFTRNSFIDNQENINVAGGGQLQGNDWSYGGKGNYWSDYAGYDEDGDEIGDIPYQSDRLFEDLMDRHASLRLFIYSPVTQAVEFAAKAFPVMKPQPKLLDERPLMKPVVPTGLRLPNQADHKWLFLFSIFLLFLAGGAIGFLILVSRIRPGKKEIYSKEGNGAMIIVKQLSKRFGSHLAVDNLSFHVQPGESLALWGPNGAGKTTVIRCLLGLLSCKGNISLGGYDIRQQGKSARRLTGFVPQEIHLHDDLSVQKTLIFYARLKGTDIHSIPELMQQLKLDSYGQKMVGALSGGMKQRLALAIALLGDPPILLLDEPSASLDIHARDEFLAMLQALKKQGKTLIFSSHRQEEVGQLADRVLLLKQGKQIDGCLVKDFMRQYSGQNLLHLYVSAEKADQALTVLAQNGLQASRNGGGVKVMVSAFEKGKPFQVLSNSDIFVTNFDMDYLNGKESDDQ